MGEIEGSYRALQTPGTRLGAQFNAGISTLEPGQSLSGNVMGGGGSGRDRSYGRLLQIRVQGLDDSQEFFDIDVSVCVCVCVIYPGDKSAVCHTAGLRLIFAAVCTHPPTGVCVWTWVCDSCRMALVLKSLPH